MASSIGIRVESVATDVGPFQPEMPLSPGFKRYFVVSALFCLAGIGFSNSAQAATAANIFAAEVAVNERTEDARKLAAAQGLARVMVKVSGDRRIAQNAAAAPLLSNALAYVQQHRFTPNGTILLGFDGRTLQRDMRAAGLPVWRSSRPATLVWLAVDYGNGDRRIIDANEQGEVRTSLETYAAERGIPLVWPLYDSVDRATVEPADVWGGFAENIVNASVRYDADAILVARVSQGSNGSFYGRWELKLDGENSEWQGGLKQSINRLTDFYAARLASPMTSGDPQTVDVLVDGLGSASAYASVLDSIQKLSIVEQAQVVGVFGAQVQLRLKIRGDASQVKRALSFSRVLTPLESAASTDGMLMYRYGR